MRITELNAEEESPVASSHYHATSEPAQVPAATANTTGSEADKDSGEMHDFLKIASKLLHRPGVQAEVINCIVEDKQVQDLMIKHNQRHILEAAQRAHLRLQQAPDLRGDELGDNPSGPNGDSQCQQSTQAPHKSGIDRAGAWLAGAGGWIRDRFHSLQSIGGGADDARGGQYEDGEEGEFSVGALAPAVIAGIACILLTRSPGLARLVAAGIAALVAKRALSHLAGAQTAETRMHGRN